MINRVILTIFAVFLLFSAVSAQNPIKSDCNFEQPTLQFIGSYGQIDHWINGECFPIQEYGKFDPRQGGDQWTFGGTLTIPFNNSATFKNVLMGLEYSSQDLDLFYGKESQWVKHQWAFKAGFTIVLGD